MVAYRNKWPVDWASYWFYEKVPRNHEIGSYPLVTKEIESLPLMHHSVEVTEIEGMKAFISMIREVSKTYGTRDLVEEFMACNCWPLLARWSISSWKENTGGVPMPDFASSFGITKDGEFWHLIMYM